MDACTSFWVEGAWICFMFVGGIAVPVDPPWLAEGLRTGFNQTGSRQEVVALVTVVVATEATSPAGPLRSQLGKWTGIQYGWFADSYTYGSLLKRINLFFTFRSTLPRPSQSRRRSSPNFTRTEDWTDLWMCRRPVALRTGRKLIKIILYPRNVEMYKGSKIMVGWRIAVKKTDAGLIFFWFSPSDSLTGQWEDEWD